MDERVGPISDKELLRVIERWMSHTAFQQLPHAMMDEARHARARLQKRVEEADAIAHSAFHGEQPS